MRDIPGYEGIYGATEDGRVWAHPRSWIAGKGVRRSHPRKWLTPTLDETGYLRVRLTAHGSRCFPAVHQVIALAWLPNPEEKPEVNHRNGIKTDCHKDNLEWVTVSANAQHAYDMGLRSMRRFRRLSDAQMQQARAELASGCDKTALAKQLGIDRKTLYGLEHGRTYQT